MNYDQNMPAPYQTAPHYNQSYYNNPAYQAQYPQNQQQPAAVQSWFQFKNSSYLKGFVVGAGVAIILSNPAVQRAMVSGAVKLWTGMQGGVEEIKEHVKDIKAEISNKE